MVCGSPFPNLLPPRTFFTFRLRTAVAEGIGNAASDGTNL